MGKALFIWLALLAVVTVMYWLNRRFSPIRPEVVVKDEFERAARQNYRLLQRSGRAIQAVLDEDAVLPTLTPQRREELQRLVNDINR